MDDRGYIFYEAKFRKDPVTESVVQNEIRQVEQTGSECYKYGFFSRSGFACEEEENRILIELKELYKKNMETGKTLILCLVAAGAFQQAKEDGVTVLEIGEAECLTAEELDDIRIKGLR